MRFLYVIYAITLFIVLMVPVFLWCLLVLPLGKVRGGNLAFLGCRVWAILWFGAIGIRHRNIFEGAPAEAEACIYVANHISYLDAALIPLLFRHPVRPLGKSGFARIPLFGLIYRRVAVTVDRSSPAARARSVAELKSLLEKGVSVLVFPEGTFNETGQPLGPFFDGAFRIAQAAGAPVRPILLLDTYARMHYRSPFSLRPGRCRAVFLPTVQPEDGETVDQLKVRVRSEMEAGLLKWGADWAH